MVMLENDIGMRADTFAASQLPLREKRKTCKKNLLPLDNFYRESGTREE
jgi:hypothetical protein